MFASKNELLTRPNGGYKLTRSLRFRSSASAYLNRTYATPTNNQKGTVSLWVKLGSIPSSNIMTIYGGVDAGGNGPYLQISLNALRFVDNSSDLITTNLFRDYAAWYHFVAVIDTTQATAANRVKLYVNGVQITAFSSATYGAQNYNSSMLSSGTQYIGYSNTANNRFADCYLAEINFIDGQALTPSSFGAFSPYNQWLPKKYSGTYGTNGFYLNFVDNSAATAAAIGKDSSGNGNNWTPNNISVTTGSSYDSMTDVPTLTSATAANYCTLNPLSTTTALTNGNLKIAATSGTTITTQLVTAGKWYWELTLDGGSNYNYFFGVQSPNQVDYVYMGMCNGGNSPNIFAVGKSTNGTATQPTGSRPTQPATIGIKLDITAGSVEFLINGTVNGSVTGITNWPTGQYWMPFFGNYTGTFGYVPLTANFGQQPFVNSLPSGFLALNTFNL